MRKDSAERSRLILEAATRCICERGFHQTSMDDIAREAEISPALIYRHFSGKQALIQELVTGYAREMVEWCHQADAEPDVHRALSIFFGVGNFSPQTAVRDGIIHVEVMAEAARNPSIAEILRKNDRYRCEVLSRIILRGGNPPENPMLAAELLLALCDGLEARSAFATIDDPAESGGLVSALHSLFSRFLDLPDLGSNNLSPDP